MVTNKELKEILSAYPDEYVVMTEDSFSGLKNRISRKHTTKETFDENDNKIIVIVFEEYEHES